MTSHWTTVKVFISSTFRDMHAERDHLIRFVFPRLRETLLKRRIHLVDVDLRWGVTSEQDALEVCRDIITECKPRFLCMLGGRYGTIPSGNELSITADEVHFGALEKHRERIYAYFYFRSGAITESMDQSNPGSIREPRHSKKADKLAQLKREVRQTNYRPLLYRPRWNADEEQLHGLTAFGSRVARDILATIDDQFGAQSPSQFDEFAEENAAMDAFVAERSERFVLGSRETVLNELLSHIHATGGNNYACLTGAPGSGKSSLLAHLSQLATLRNLSSTLLIRHFVGASSGSTDVRCTLRRLCHELKVACPESTAVIPDGLEELCVAFPKFLRQACVGRRVVILLDALNQFETASPPLGIHWMPTDLPADVRIIVTSLAGPTLEELHRSLKPKEFELKALTADDGEAIVEQFLKRYGKTLEPDQRTSLLSKSDARTPLYLLAALEELRTLGSYDNISERIAELPATTHELFAWILKRLERDDGFRDAVGRPVGRELVSQFAALLVASRYGLAQREIVDLLDAGDPLGNIAALLHLLRPYLMHRGELLDFCHSQIREVAADAYLNEEQDRLETHRNLAVYFQGLLNPANSDPWSGVNPRALAELPYHQRQAESWDELETTLCDLRFVQANCMAGLTFDLAAEYPIAIYGLPELQDERRSESQTHEPLKQYVLDLIAYAEASGEGVMSPKLSDKQPSLESTRPGAVGSTTPHSRAARLQAFANFVSVNSHLLFRFPEQTLPIAYNFASDGPVAEQADICIDAFTTAWLRRTSRPPVTERTHLCVRTLEGHTGSVNAVAITPDGKTAVSGSADSTVGVWDISSGALIKTLKGHKGAVNGVAMTPDGRIAVSGGSDRKLRVWDIGSGRLLWTLKGHRRWISDVALTPDGRTAVSASVDFTVRVWDVTAGRLRKTLHGHERYVSAVAVTPDGKMVSVDEGRTIRVWDVAEKKRNVLGQRWLLRVIESYESIDGSDVAMTPDGGTFITAGSCIREWSIRGEERRFGLGFGSAVEVTADRTRVFSAELDEIKVWNYANGQRIVTLRGHRSTTNALAITPGGNIVVSASEDKTLRVWDLSNLERLETSNKPVLYESGLAICPDGDKVVSATYPSTNVTVRDIASGNVLWDLEGHTSAITAVAVTPDGSTAISAAHDNTLRLWDVACGVLLKTLEGPTHTIRKLAISSRRDMVVSINQDWHAKRHFLCIWDVDGGKGPRVLKGHKTGIEAVVITPDNQTAVSAGRDKTLRVWNLRENAGFSGLRKLLRGLRSFLKKESVECQHTLRGHRNSVAALAITRDGKLAVSASYDHTLRVWNVANGKPLRTLQGHTGGVLSVALTSDGQTAISGGVDRSLRVWDIPRGELVKTISGHTAAVRIVTLVPGEEMVVSVDDDATLRVWSIDTGKSVAVYFLDSNCVGVATSDDKYMVAGCKSGQLHFLTLRNWQSLSTDHLADEEIR